MHPTKAPGPFFLSFIKKKILAYCKPRCDWDNFRSP